VGGDLEDGTESISPSTIESQHLEEFLHEEGSQMRPDIARCEQLKRSCSTSSSQILFGNEGGLKKRDRKAGDKEQEKQKKLEDGTRKSSDSADSKVSRITGKSFGKAVKGMPGTVFEVEGVKFTVLDEKDAGGNRMVQCQCQDKVRRDNAKRHTDRNKH
jgi:hypothetical protein